MVVIAGFFANVNARSVCAFTPIFRELSEIFGSADQRHPGGVPSVICLPGWLDCSSALLASAIVRSLHSPICSRAGARVRACSADPERSNNAPLAIEAKRIPFMVASCAENWNFLTRTAVGERPLGKTIWRLEPYLKRPGQTFARTVGNVRFLPRP